MRILFFLESLHCGGKERRALELIQFLKQRDNYEIALVLTEEDVYYEEIYNLDITIEILKRKGTKYDPRLFFEFYRICRRFRPDIVHAWGKMTTFYASPVKIMCGFPLISSLIADSSRSYGRFSFYNLLLISNVFFSDIILSNSKAGLLAYKIDTPKARVIYNGVNPERFQKQYDTVKVREELGIKTKYVLVMVANFSKFKDYDLFIELSKETMKIRNDVTFVGVGDGSEWKRIRQRVNDEQVSNVILTGKQKEVERIITASDIGLLCTYSEGISNSIIEYMALGKPTIVTDLIGGSREIVIEGETGYCTNRRQEEIITIINTLLESQELRQSMGAKGKHRITAHFSIDSMGKNFENVYNEILSIK